LEIKQRGRPVVIVKEEKVMVAKVTLKAVHLFQDGLINMECPADGMRCALSNENGKMNPSSPSGVLVCD